MICPIYPHWTPIGPRVSEQEDLTLACFSKMMARFVWILGVPEKCQMWIQNIEEQLLKGCWEELGQKGIHEVKNRGCTLD